MSANKKNKFHLLRKALAVWPLVIPTLLIIFAGPANANFITSTYELDGSGWSVAVNPQWDITVVVDAITDQAVIIEIQKTFVGEPDEFDLLPAMYLEFIKNSPHALGQIIITDEFVVNDTSEDWIDFHFELAVNPQSPKAAFSPESLPSGDQFDTVIFSGPVILGDQELFTRIDFSNGIVPNQPPGQDSFRPGFDSGAMIIIVDSELEVGERIRLKEFPTIPEPAVISMLFLGLAVFLGRRKL